MHSTVDVNVGQNARMTALGVLGMIAGRHHHHVTDGQEAWSRLWPLLVTAGLTLVVLGCIQFYVVPRVEARKRREDRWEQDVLALGELLTFEFPNALSDLRKELWGEAALDGLAQAADVNQSRLEELKRVGRESQNAALDAHRGLDARIEWLTDRIVSIDPGSPRLLQFKWRQLRLGLGELEHLAARYRLVDRPVPTEEEINAADSKDREVLKLLTTEVSTLAAARPVRAATKRRTLARKVLARVKKVLRRPKK